MRGWPPRSRSTTAKEFVVMKGHKEFNSVVVNLVAEHAVRVFKERIKAEGYSSRISSEENQEIVRHDAKAWTRKVLPLFLKIIDKGDGGLATAEDLLLYARATGLEYARSLCEYHDAICASIALEEGGPAAQKEWDEICDDFHKQIDHDVREAWGAVKAAIEQQSVINV
jgi:hypothetical protein